MPEILRWPAKLRMTEIKQRDGSLNPVMKRQAVERLTSSLIDRTWSQNGSAVDPVLKVHVDDTFIYVSLLAADVEPAAGIRWRNNFNTMRYRADVEKAVERAVANYEAQRHDQGFLVTKDGFSIVPVDDLARPMPRGV